MDPLYIEVGMRVPLYIEEELIALSSTESGLSYALREAIHMMEILKEK